jgi:hypothetical protein
MCHNQAKENLIAITYFSAPNAPFYPVQYIWEGAQEFTFLKSSPGDSDTQPGLGITV